MRLANSGNGDHFLGGIAYRFMGFTAADKPTTSAQINAGGSVGERDSLVSGVTGFPHETKLLTKSALAFPAAVPFYTFPEITAL